MKIHKFTYNPFEENTYVAEGADRRCVIIDPGCYYPGEHETFFAFLEENALIPEAILLTHCHFDHIGGVSALCARYGIPVYASSREQVVMDDRKLLQRLQIRLPDTSFTISDVSEGTAVEAAGFRFEAIGTPGHTPGGLSWYEKEEGVVFTGDTLFAGAIGRSDFDYSDYDSEIKAIMEKLMALPGPTQVLPGHGGKTTIARERSGNPFLEPFNEPEEDTDADNLEPIIISR